MENWKTEKLASTYIEGVRGAIPLAQEQIEILLRIIGHFRPNVQSFIDLGCGDGILGHTLFMNFPESKGIFLDYSEPMIKAARSRCSQYAKQGQYIIEDFGREDWVQTISGDIPVDVVVSGFSIHHQENENKKRLYADIYDNLLKPGGVFLDLDQVASPNNQIEKMFDAYFLDSIKQYQQEFSSGISVDSIKEAYYKDKEVNILAPVEDQCEWLRKVGFINVDCYFKAFELAIFGGVKPE